MKKIIFIIFCAVVSCSNILSMDKVEEYMEDCRRAQKTYNIYVVRDILAQEIATKIDHSILRGDDYYNYNIGQLANVLKKISENENPFMPYTYSLSDSDWINKAEEFVNRIKKTNRYF
ncbi:MAG: hypothetical protein IJ730_02765 [Alphaproteobacteria bacterium]|nr:hypothetical protein [Alphaproteobacteria bacterium]